MDSNKKQDPRSALEHAYADAAIALVRLAKLRNEQREMEGEETMDIMCQVENDLEEADYVIRMHVEQILADEQNAQQ